MDKSDLMVSGPVYKLELLWLVHLLDYNGGYMTHIRLLLDYRPQEDFKNQSNKLLLYLLTFRTHLEIYKNIQYKR